MFTLSDKRLFLFLVFGLFLINLILKISEIHFIDISEATVYNDFGKNSAISEFLKILFYPFASFMGDTLYKFRLSSILATLLSIISIYFLGKKLFGKEGILLGLVVLASSFLWNTIARTGVGEAWLFLFQSVVFFSTILYIKQPVFKWRLLNILACILGLMIHFIPTLIFIMVYHTLLYFLHPKGKNVLTLYSWLSILIGGGAYFILNGQLWTTNGFIFNWSTIDLKYVLAFLLLGIFPWIAFLPAALIHLYKKGHNKEELSIIFGAGLLGALCSYSIVLILILALMLGKQVQTFPQKIYPYRNWVKTLSILHLILVFFLVLYFILYGITSYEGKGFYAAIVTGGMYWSCALISVIGIFGNRMRFTVGGMAFSGLLFLYFFWSMWLPIVLPIPK